MKKILLLQTGGTIAMHFDSSGVQLQSNKWLNVLYKEIPELRQIADIELESVFFEDSSDVNQTHWKQLAELIFERRNSCDGIVVLHGTDTMAYTASALSFALQNLPIPVIFTGSQVPLSNIRSDARRNLVNSVELATHPIFEIAICFNDHLFRGSRSTKMSIGDFDAFSSPNFPALADIGIKIRFSDEIRTVNHAEAVCSPLFDDTVHVIKVFPNLNPEMLDCINLERTNAVIFEAFGIGNIPIKGRYNLLPFVEKCRDQKCHVIVNSQAPYDSVDLTQYSSGQELEKLGALSAGDMTMEATITKTMYLLSHKFEDSAFRTSFLKNLTGERSEI